MGNSTSANVAPTTTPASAAVATTPAISARPYYPGVQPAGVHLLLEADPAQRVQRIHELSAGTFSVIANNEITRLASYYRACSDFLTNANQARALADVLGIGADEYKAIVASKNTDSYKVLEEMQCRAFAQGMKATEIEAIVKKVPTINTVLMARQRMLEGGSVLLSTPVLMRDFFDGGKVAGAGFGDGKTTQIFQGKAMIQDIRFSAVASPRVHKDVAAGKDGYVLRFAVVNCPGEGNFSVYHPGFMLDNRVVDNIERWHKSEFPGLPLEKNPLLAGLSKELAPIVHDWFHGWFIYDVNAHSATYKQWGADIFFVPHLTENKLLINYEMLSLWTHKNTLETIYAGEPQQKTERYKGLANVLDAAESFGKWMIANGESAVTAREQTDYLAYILLSNNVMTLSPKEPEMAGLLARYPVVQKQIERIFQPLFDVLYSDNLGVPSLKEGGKLEPIVQYIGRYPLKDEVAERLRTQVTADAEASQAELARLPLAVRAQVGSDVVSSPVFKLLNAAFDQLRAELPAQDAASLIDTLANKLVLDEAGRVFLKLERRDFDYSGMSIRKQDKRVLLIEVPEGQTINLQFEYAVSLVNRVSKQVTRATDEDVIAINIKDEGIAKRLLAQHTSADGINIPKLLESARDLAERGVEGAGDIYPLRYAKARELYDYFGPGYYQSLGRQRYIVRSEGPIILPLHDGSQQKLVDGVITYIPPNTRKTGNADPDPDTHGIERDAYIKTFSSPDFEGLGVQKLRPGSSLASLYGPDGKEDVELTSKLVGKFLSQLKAINNLVIHGDRSHLAEGLFTHM